MFDFLDKIFKFPTEIVTGAKIYEFSNLFGGKPIQLSETITTTWIIMILLTLLFYWGGKNLELVPGKKQVVFELLYDFYDWLAGNVLKKWKTKFMAYVAALMTFLFVSNTISLIPIPTFSKIDGVIHVDAFFKTPTSDLNTTVGLALITAAVFLFYGIKLNGIWGYIKSLMSPNIAMLPLNIIGEIAKPLNISMRLFGNMLGGAVIMTLLYQFTSWIFSKSFIPAPIIIVPLHLYFDIFAGIMQSFVFTMLTLVYISMAIGDKEPEPEI